MKTLQENEFYDRIITCVENREHKDYVINIWSLDHGYAVAEDSFIRKFPIYYFSSQKYAIEWVENYIEQLQEDEPESDYGIDCMDVYKDFIENE